MFSLSLLTQICVPYLKGLGVISLKKFLGNIHEKGLEAFNVENTVEIGKSQLKIQTCSRNSISCIEYIRITKNYLTSGF